MSKQFRESCAKSASQKAKPSSKKIQFEPCRGCGHPKASSSSNDRNDDDGIKLPNTVRFLFENFKSLYQDGHYFQTKLSSEPVVPKTLAKPVEGSSSGDFIAVLTYSPSPYTEFRRSMAEMVDVRSGRGEKVDWDYLEELLFRYLNLNNEKAERFIVRAFVDLVVRLHENKTVTN